MRVAARLLKRCCDPLQGVGCTPWRPLVSAALPVAFAWQLRRRVFCRGSDVRPGVPWSPSLCHLTHRHIRITSACNHIYYKLPLAPGTHIVNTLPKWHTCACTYIHTHKLTHHHPSITPPPPLHHPSITLILPLPLLLFYAQSKSGEVVNMWGYPVLLLLLLLLVLLLLLLHLKTILPLLVPPCFAGVGGSAKNAIMCAFHCSSICVAGSCTTYLRRNSASNYLDTFATGLSYLFG